MKSALIVEDHPEAQRWLQETLKMAFPHIQITVTGSIHAALKWLSEHFSDIALIDLNLPDGNGVEVIQHLSLNAPDTLSVVSTIYDDDEHLFPALRAGAKGYILKEQRQEDIARMLEGILRGEPPLTPSISLRILNHFSAPAAPATTDAPVEHNLTEKELCVLSVIAKGNSIKETARQLCLSPNTVATHVKNIYLKLKITSRAEAALAANQLGILPN